MIQKQKERKQFDHGWVKYVVESLGRYENGNLPEFIHLVSVSLLVNNQSWFDKPKTIRITSGRL